MASKYFSLKELSKTETGMVNTPPSTVMPKIENLGRVLDTIYERIGPFKIVSAYRSPATQTALKSGAAGAASAAQAAKQSYHTTGQAADILPTTMTVQQFYTKIVQTPDVAKLMGAFAIKNTVIHLDTDTSWRSAVAMYVDKAGNYIRFTTDELKNFISRNKVGVAAGGLVLIIAAGIGAYLFINRNKKG